MKGDWVFPKATCFAMWQQWMCYDSINKITPMKDFDPIDVEHLPKGNMLLSELKNLMKGFENEVTLLSLWKHSMTYT